MNSDNKKILFFDIETDDRISGVEVGRDQILSWAAVGEGGMVYYHISDDEQAVISSIFQLISEYDVICGWNSEKFDVPYLKIRAKANGVDASVLSRREHIDMKKLFKKIEKEEIFCLNDISGKYLSDKKIDLNNKKIYDLFLKDREKLLEYNIKDAKILYDLNKKTKILNKK